MPEETTATEEITVDYTRLPNLAQIRQMALKTKSENASILSTVLAALVEMDNVKLDKPTVTSVTIPIVDENEESTWSSDNTVNFPYYYDITASGVTVNDIAHVVFSNSSHKIILKCGMSAVCETLAGVIRIRANSIPTESISAQWWIEPSQQAAQS